MLHCISYFTLSLNISTSICTRVLCFYTCPVIFALHVALCFIYWSCQHKNLFLYRGLIGFFLFWHSILAEENFLFVYMSKWILFCFSQFVYFVYQRCFSHCRRVLSLAKIDFALCVITSRYSIVKDVISSSIVRCFM